MSKKEFEALEKVVASLKLENKELGDVIVAANQSAEQVAELVKEKDVIIEKMQAEIDSLLESDTKSAEQVGPSFEELAKRKPRNGYVYESGAGGIGLVEVKVK